MKKNRIKSFFGFIIIFLYCFIFWSCNTVMIKAIGIKAMKPKSVEQIQRYSKKYKIPNELSFVIDTNSLCERLNALDSSQNSVSKDLLQPLQVRAYSKSNDGEMSFFMANCYAGGFPNLDWNNSESFNGDLLNDSINSNGKFIGFISAVRDFQMENVDTSFTLRNDLFRLRHLHNDLTVYLYEDDSPYIVVVYWTIFMNRQSKRLISLLQDFQRRSKKEIKLYYINIDNLYHIPCLNAN